MQQADPSVRAAAGIFADRQAWNSGAEDSARMDARDYERARSALAFIPSDDRDLWVSVGMAIKDGFGDEGFALWDAWSRQSGRYNERDARDVWRSLKAGGGITLGTLFHEAKARSWRDDGTYQKPTPEEIEARRREAAERTAKEEAEKGRNGSKSSNNSGSKPWERENRWHLRAPRRRRLVVARLRPRARRPDHRGR